MLVYLVDPGVFVTGSRWKNIDLNLEPFEIKALWMSHHRAPTIVQRNTLNFPPLHSFRLMYSTYYYFLFAELSHSGVVEWNVRVSNFSLRTKFRSVCNSRYKVSHAGRLLSRRDGINGVLDSGCKFIDSRRLSDIGASWGERKQPPLLLLLITWTMWKKGEAKKEETH